MEELVTKKIYYKKYDHRLVIRVRAFSSPAEKARPTPEIIQWILDQAGVKDWRGIASTSYEHGWHNRKCFYTVFSKSLSAYELLRDRVGSQHLLTLEKPLDDAHTALMAREKVVTRKKLFYDTYRIAIRVKCKKNPGGYGTITKHIDDMQKWTTENIGPLTNRENRERYHVNRWHDATFFFRDAKDALLFKLTWGEDISQTERVVLVSELEAQRA